MTAKSLLPVHYSNLEHALERTGGQRLAALSYPAKFLWSADDCPAAFLHLLAMAVSVDLWDEGWSDDVKRNVIRDTPRIHRHKGTLAAVKLVLDAAGYGDASVLEGLSAECYDGSINYDGTFYYGAKAPWAFYRVYLTRPISLTQAAQVRALLSITAPRRCVLAGLFYTQALNLYNCAINYDGNYSHGVA